MATPALDDTYSRIDVLEKVPSREAMSFHFMDDPLEAVVIGYDVTGTRIWKNEEYARLFNMSTTSTPRQCPKELFIVEVQDFEEKERVLLR